MHRCRIDPDCWTSSHVTLGEGEARHLYKVVRAQAGQTVGVFDGAGRTAEATVGDVPEVLTLVAGSETTHRRLAHVTLFLSLLKSTRWELALEKATELGVATIVPVAADNCVARLDAKGAAAKHTRWSRIVESAVKQCGNPWLPDIEAPITVPQLAERDLDWLAVGALENASVTLGAGLRAHLVSGTGATMPRLGVAIGPEGDFTAAEMQLLISSGAIPVSLGPRVLRAETAAMFGLSVIASELDDANV